MAGQWRVICSNRGYHITLPDVLARTATQTRVNEENKELNAWAKIETRIVSALHGQFHANRTYMRLYTYYTPTDLLALKTECHFEEPETKERGTHLYLIENCNVKPVWEAFFRTATNWDGGRTLFMTDQIFADLRLAMEVMSEIVQRLSSGRPLANLDEHLSRCRVLCYSVDADLVIAKVDLSEESIFRILKVIADSENLELKVERRKLSSKL